MADWKGEPRATATVYRAYNPTPSERVGNWIQDLLMSGGAQAYPAGHVAHGVRDLLSLSPLGIGMSAADLLHAKSAGDPMGAAAAAIGMVPGLKPEVQAVRQGIRAYHGSPHDFDRFDISKIGTGEGAQAYGHGLYFAENEAVARSYRPTIEQGSAAAGIGLKDSGKMYEVNINAKPEQFLDWDKPISQQQLILDKLNFGQKDIRELETQRLGKEPPGSDLYWYLNPNAARASAELAEAGIPGVRYLDQGSRNVASARPDFNVQWSEKTGTYHLIDLTTGQSTAQYPNLSAATKAARQPEQRTSNYVLFNDQLIDIMRKYGLAAPAAAGAASFAMAPQETQAGKAQAAQFQQPVALSDRINQMVDSLQWGDQWQGRMRLPLERKVNSMLGESVWPPLR